MGNQPRWGPLPVTSKVSYNPTFRGWKKPSYPFMFVPAIYSGFVTPFITFRRDPLQVFVIIQWFCNSGESVAAFLGLFPINKVTRTPGMPRNKHYTGPGLENHMSWHPHDSVVGSWKRSWIGLITKGWFCTKVVRWDFLSILTSQEPIFFPICIPDLHGSIFIRHGFPINSV